MKESRDAGIKPDAGTYERYIILCLTQPTYEDAFFYLEEMKGAGFKPTFKVYDSIIRRALRAQDSRWKLAVTELLEAKYRMTPGLKALIDRHESGQLRLHPVYIDLPDVSYSKHTPCTVGGDCMIRWKHSATNSDVC